MEIENYNKELRTYLKSLGLTIASLEVVLGISQYSISHRLNKHNRRKPITKEEFIKIVTYFKNKSNELYNDYTKKQEETN